jgi:hypothetical protein
MNSIICMFYFIKDKKSNNKQTNKEEKKKGKRKHISWSSSLSWIGMFLDQSFIYLFSWLVFVFN